MKIANAIRYAVTLMIVLVACFGIPEHAFAQSTDQISGTITDQNGAIVPGAQVKATNTATGTIQTTESKSDGLYSFPALAIGPYKLEVTRQGFQTFVQNGITLQVNTNPTVNITLQVGNVSQTIEVQADAAMVETQTNSVGSVIQPEQVVDLPLNNRQATQLITLAGGAVNTSGNSGGLTGTLDYPTTVSFSIAGSQRNATNYLLDGSPNMDYRSNVGSPMPFPDALQEFKVESSTVPANAGSRPGGVVGGITKSGTNALHGDIFEFLRNGVLDADSYNFPAANGTLGTPTHDNLKRNQYGGVVGGPIKKDNLFFFYGGQETAERFTQNPTTTTVPTAAMLAGNFVTFLSAKSAGGCQSSAVTLNSTVTFNGVAYPLTTAPGSNIINPIWLNSPSGKVAANVAKYFGAPPTNPCGSETTAGYQHDNEYQHVGRLDWQRSTKDSLFARYYITNYTLLSTLQSPGGVANVLTSSGIGEADRVQNMSFGDTYVLSSRTLSSARLNYVRTATQRTSNTTIPNVCALGMLATCPVPHLVNDLVNKPGYQGWDYENSVTISENIAWLLGKHQLNFGFAGTYLQMNGNGTFQLDPVPGYSSGGSSYTGNNDADFVTGLIDTFGQGNGQLSHDGQYMPELYFADNWKVTKTLQVNYGVRWDPYYPQHNKYGMASDFNIAQYAANTPISTKYVNAPPGVTFPDDPGSNGSSDTLNHSWNFSPRVGIVWDPRGKGKETIRAGYGMFYDTSLMWNAMHVVLNAPWGNTVSFTPLAYNPNDPVATDGGGSANPYYAQPGGNIFPTPFIPPSTWPFAANGAFVFQDQGMVPPDAQAWNFSIQKQFGSNWLVSISYMGNKGTHVWLGTNPNPDVLITSGMTGPAIIANNVTPGTPTTGSCTLLYQGNQYTFNPCNQTSTAKTATVNGVNDESARKALNLLNPTQGYKMNGGVLYARAIGNSAYNGALFSVEHRLSHGFSINGNFTWSHCLDTGETGQDIAASFQIPTNPKAEWGNCSYDRRKIFNLSLVGQSPNFQNRAERLILSDWNGSGIFTASTGPYSEVVVGADNSLIGLGGVPGSGGSGNDRPNQVGNPFQAGTIAANPSCVGPAKVKTSINWFNPCAFQVAPLGTFGNTARNSLLGPGVWNFDAAVWRTFRLTERFKLDFRFEAFNLFNHPQWGQPGVTETTTSSFDYISATSTGVDNQRIGQAALKITF